MKVEQEQTLGIALGYQGEELYLLQELIIKKLLILRRTQIIFI